MTGRRFSCVSDSSRFIRQRAQYAARWRVVVKADLLKGAEGLTGHQLASLSHGRSARTPLGAIRFGTPGFSQCATMDQKCLPSWRNPARYPTSHDADVFVHASHLMGGVHQRGGRRAAYRAAHRGTVGPERSGRSILKITSLCRCAGPQEAAFCVLRAMRHRGCYGISGRVFEHRGS